MNIQPNYLENFQYQNVEKPQLIQQIAQNPQPYELPRVENENSYNEKIIEQTLQRTPLMSTQYNVSTITNDTEATKNLETVNQINVDVNFSEK